MKTDTMLKNFLKIAFRNLARNKGFSIINIGGLAIGMASALLILLWVQNEVRYDRFYQNSDRLYQAWNRDKGNAGISCWNVTPKMLSMGLKQDYPEVEKATRVNWTQTILFTVGEKKLNIPGTMVDPDFLPMFGFPFLKGDMNTALDAPDKIVLTKKLAIKLFGSEDAMGKTVRLDNKFDFRVSGILKDLPNNTQFDFEYLTPWTFMRSIHQDDSSWDNNSTHNFVLLKPHTDLAAFNEKIRNIYIRHTDASTTTKCFLYPVSKLRLYSSFKEGVPSGGRIETVRVFVLIAVFILLIACINFMNMSTARSEKRAKEVGIRKVVGARKGSLIGQFLGESVLIACISGLLALLIVQLCLPPFNTLTGKQLAIAYDTPVFWLAFSGFLLFTGLLAGSYPAFFLSSFRPVAIFKGIFKRSNALVTPRKALVVLQFTCAIILIVGTIIIREQVQYAQDRKTGYDKENVIYIFLSGDMIKNYESIKNDLIGQGIASAISKTSAPLTEGWSSGGAQWPGKNPKDKIEFNYFNTDGGLVKTAGLQLVQGRDIDLKNYPTDSNAVVINEAAARTMALKDPIGQIINQGEWETNWHIVGVVKDFILQSPYESIKPMIIQGPKANWFNLVHLRFPGSHSTRESLAATEKVFRQYNPQYPFEYHFIDQQYARKFADEQLTAKLTAIFAGLIIFISCLGLFGLATYMAENRIKEIGIRKVLGASVAGIATMLSKDFVRLVLIAILIATPIAWWSMDKWLAGYDYRMSISWWIFAAAGMIAILIALITVSFQAIRAAVANPVRSLRSE